MKISMLRTISYIFLLSFSVLSAQSNYTINIDWSVTNGSISNNHWGVADYEVLRSHSVKNPGFVGYMKELKPGFVRIHNASIARDKYWTNTSTGTWRNDSVVKCLRAATDAYGNAKVMLNTVASWPEFINSTTPVLNPVQEAKIVKLHYELAKLVKDSNLKVDYFEVFNEIEKDKGEYAETNQMNKLYALFNRVADTMRLVLPNAKIGGLAFTYPDMAWINGFLDNCGSRLSFVSWHNYSNGPNSGKSDVDIVTTQVGTIVSQAQSVVNELKKRNLQNTIETFITEFNIQWVWEPFEPRHANNVGAIFHSSIVNRLAEMGLTATAVWHVKGNSYGLIDDSYNVRATGNVYKWGTRFLTGERPKIVSQPGKDLIEVIAVKNGLNGKSVLLLNKKTTASIIPADSLNISDTMRIMTIDANSYYPYPIYVSNDSKITLPPMSATLVTNISRTDFTKPIKPVFNGYGQFTTAVFNFSSLLDNKKVVNIKLYKNEELFKIISTTSSVTLGGLVHNSTYIFKIKTTDEEGNESEFSEPITITTAKDASPPTSPKDLTIEPLSNQGILLSWKKSTDNVGVTGYQVFVDGTYIKTVIDNFTEFDNTVNLNVNHSFAVKAIDAEGNLSDPTTIVFSTIVNNQSLQTLVFPNPIVGDQFYVSIMNLTSKIYSVKLLDVNGKAYNTKWNIADSQSNLLAIKTNNLKQGIYYLSIKTNNFNSNTLLKLLIN